MFWLQFALSSFVTIWLHRSLFAQMVDLKVYFQILKSILICILKFQSTLAKMYNYHFVQRKKTSMQVISHILINDSNEALQFQTASNKA